MCSFFELFEGTNLYALFVPVLIYLPGCMLRCFYVLSIPVEFVYKYLVCLEEKPD